MSGFRSNNIAITDVFSRIRGPIKKFLRAGQEYDDLIIDNKLGVGMREAQAIKSGFSEEADIYFASTYDINSASSKTIGYFQQDYKSRVEHLRQMSTHREISKFISIIADEAVVYDDNGFFAQPHTSMLDDLEDGVEKKVKEDLLDNFEHIYTNVFRFKESTTGFRYFKKFLIDGVLAFELIYNKEGTRIIGSNLLDPTALAPNVAFIDGQWTRVWVMYPGDMQLERILPDSHIVYVSYGSGDPYDDISYVQGLIRSFNLYRTIENTAVMWNIMNSSFRLKTIVPAAGGRVKNEEAVSEVVGRFKEDVQIDNNSGEVRVDGQASINLFRNYAVASKAGKQTEIESLNFTGYDMSNPDLLKYWRDKLWEESLIPYTRLQRDSSNPFASAAEGMEREEMTFGKFINRLRSSFREILVKPLYTQMTLDYPDFKEDEYFKSKISVKFHKENMFDLYWTRDNMQKDVDFINTMMGVQKEGKPFFDLELLIEHYTTFDYDFIQKNIEKYDEVNTKKKDVKEDEESSEDLGVDMGDDQELEITAEDTPETESTDDLGLDMPDAGDLNLDLDLDS